MTVINDRFELHVENHIAYVSMTRPEKMNALDHKTFEAIPQVCLLYTSPSPRDA